MTLRTSWCGFSLPEAVWLANNITGLAQAMRSMNKATIRPGFFQDCPLFQGRVLD